MTRRHAIGEALTLCPVTLKEAQRFIMLHHRHSRPPIGAVFSVGLSNGSDLCGVAMAGRPVARHLQDGSTLEVSRVSTIVSNNACSMLYGACKRAAAALGWKRLVTYTLAEEPGSSLLASGFCRAASVPGRETWSTPSRLRVQTDMFGEAQRPIGPKTRWVVDL